jgi:2-polyprenyl-6-methoxyphenol hydroxylase-like FAD-dependent oxidoreductase
MALRMRHEVTGLLRNGPVVTGVRYRSPTGDGELLADLVVACDGRTSTVRRESGLPVREWSVPFDVWWFRLPRDVNAGYSLVPRTAPGRLAVVIPREGYFQIGYLIPKGSDEQLRARGLASFRAEIAALMPEADTSGLSSWDDVKLLDVKVNRLKRWHTGGLLCIGDAAHAMSPMGGVGINLAVQDAVGAATLLAEPLRRRTVTDADLAAVRRRRLPPTTITQGLQRFLHRRLVVPVFRGADGKPPAVFVQVLQKLPWLTVIPARIIGVGIRPERAPTFARR